jgi:hypothetical protein
MGEVRVRPNKIDRGYSRTGPLTFHNDRIDMLALFCIRAALSGGANVFVSLLKVYEVITHEHPEILPILERGLYMHRLGEQPAGEGPVTSHRVPIFAVADNLLSGLVSANAVLDLQLRYFADTLKPEEIKALEVMKAIFHRPELGFRLMLDPGEMIFINNYEVLHSREDFKDPETPDQGRFLLRLWLAGRPWRPKVPEMIVFNNRSGEQGIDPQPHPGEGALAE